MENVAFSLGPKTRYFEPNAKNNVKVYLIENKDNYGVLISAQSFTPHNLGIYVDLSTQCE